MDCPIVALRSGLPVNFIKNGYKGYLEDRRPNSEADPYQIVSRILKTINSVPKPEAAMAFSSNGASAH